MCSHLRHSEIRPISFLVEVRRQNNFYSTLKLILYFLGDVPLLLPFLDVCKSDLQNPDISKRPTFKTILEHDFFNHDFIIIHSFLLELPLKNDTEKMHFFQNLTEKLLQFDEEVVASQLSGLLLSRLVLLNKSAQNSLLPSLLTPHDGKHFSISISKIDILKQILK